MGTVTRIYKADTYNRDTAIAEGAGVASGAAGAVSAGRAVHHREAAQKLRSSLPPPKRTWKVWKQPSNLAAANKLRLDIYGHEVARARGKIGAVAGGVGALAGIGGAMEIQRAKRRNQLEAGVAKSAFGVEDTRLESISKLGMGLDHVPAGLGGKVLKPLKTLGSNLKAMPKGVKSTVQDLGQDVPNTVGGWTKASPHIGRAVLAVPGVKPTLAVGGGAAGVAALGNGRRNNQY